MLKLMEGLYSYTQGKINLVKKIQPLNTGATRLAPQTNIGLGVGESRN
jgi:hypothetical protein